MAALPTSAPAAPPSRLRRASLTTHLLGVLLCVGAGCGSPADIRPGDIRTYRIPRPAEAVVKKNEPAADRAGPRLTYEVPPGWSDRGASGMRLATLAIGAAADAPEVTVIPAAGSLESNVARWVGQLDEQADEATRNERAAAAISTAETVDVDGTKATVVLLVAAEGDDDDEKRPTILGAMIPVDGSSALFVKYKGDAAIARRERENFDRFVASIRWK